MKYTTPAQRIAELAREHGSYRAAARAIGIDHVYLHRVATGKKEPSAHLLALLGLKRHVRYSRMVG